MKLITLLVLGLLFISCNDAVGPKPIPYSVSAQTVPDSTTPPPVCLEWGWQSIPGLPWKIMVCLRWSNDRPF